jgi:membrane protease YdiL (CAAX protease family)
MSPVEESGPRPCRKCGSPVRANAAYCASCGLATHEHRRRTKKAADDETRGVARAGRIAWFVFGGALGAIVIQGVVRGLGILPPLLVDAVGNLLLLATGVLATRALGRGGFRTTLPMRARPSDFAWSIPGAVACAGAAYLWTRLLGSLSGDSRPEEEEGRRLLEGILVVAVCPALVEEWLCRGVLWPALRSRTGAGLTVLVSSILFAFLHGLEGGFVLSLPHRFVAGLALGYLRERSGSLTAPMLAHFLHNAFWVLRGEA